MATYADLYDLHNYTALINKVAVACIVAAEMVHDEDVETTNHANRLIWAAGVFGNPKQEAHQMYWALLAANKAASVETIQEALDSTIQTEVEAHIDLFATG